MTKKLTFCLFFFISGISFTQASHLSGGDIQYKYIGDSTGVAHHYEVLLRIYRDVTGVSLGSTATVTVSSSCYSDSIITCNLIAGTGSGNVAPSLFDCVSQGSPTTKTLEIWAYKGVAILPGKCADFSFYWATCCRPPGITNIPGSSGKGFYFEATLNNLIGNNSSPQFINEPTRAFCVGNNFNWKQNSIELDGDSIYYSLIPCREMSSGNSISNIPFATGYTAQHPITTPTGYPGIFNMNYFTGIMNFTPAQQEIDVMAVLIEEFRYDSILNTYLKIGSSNRDLMITVSPTCSPTAQQGILYDYSGSNFYQDSISGLPILNANCNDSGFTIPFTSKLDCSSIAPDGSDFFLLVNATQQPKAIIGTTTNCDINGETKEIYVHLYQPFIVDGDYYLTTKVGSDGNTILSKCGMPNVTNDTLVLRVTGCSGVGLEEWQKLNFKIFPNPTSEVLTIKNLNTKIKLRTVVIYTNSGKQIASHVLSENNNFSANINVEKFESGLYFIELRTATGVFYRKFVKI